MRKDKPELAANRAGTYREALVDAFNAVAGLDARPHRAGKFKRKAIQAIAKLIVKVDEKYPNAYKPSRDA